MSGSYYIKAHKNGRSLSIPIEEKHVYVQLTPSTASAPTAYVGGSLYKLNQGSGATSMCPSPESFVVITSADSNSFVTASGVQEAQRIGQKLQLVNVDHYINICLDGNSISGHLAHGNMVDMEFKFRLMTVKFDQQMNAITLEQWWSDTRIYYGAYTGGSPAHPQRISSVWTDALSESNQWTGRFKILYDDKFTLGKEHTSAMKHIHLSPKMNLTFNSYNKATNDDFENTYTFIVMPIQYATDIDAVSADIMTRTATPNEVPLIKCNAETKYTYYDL